MPPTTRQWSFSCLGPGLTVILGLVCDSLPPSQNPYSTYEPIVVVPGLVTTCRLWCPTYNSGSLNPSSDSVGGRSLVLLRILDTSSDSPTQHSDPPEVVGPTVDPPGPGPEGEPSEREESRTCMTRSSDVSLLLTELVSRFTPTSRHGRSVEWNLTKETLVEERTN